MVFIEGVLLQGHSATRIKKHDVPEGCEYLMRSSKLHLNMPIPKASKEETHEIWVLVAKANKKGRGYEFLARSQQRNHGCEVLANAHNGSYTQSNSQRSHDCKSLERINKKAIPTIICSRKYMGSNSACNGTKPKHA